MRNGKMTRLIDAQDAFKVLSDYYHHHTSAQHLALQEALNKVPTADAEPVRHGKWVFNPSDALEAMFAKPKCSECGFESADGGNYCPNCGCRMDEKCA
jgi:hypothetical protein